MTGRSAMLAAQGARDANHAAIVERYEAYFCKVLDLHSVGGGCPDTLVRITTRAGHVLQLVEIKTEDGSLSASQERFRDEWAGQVCVTVRTVQDVDAHVERVRRAAR